MILHQKSRGEGREPVIICIGGLAGSGKSTLAKKIAEKYDLRYFSGGDALMALAIEEGYKPLQHGWWESQEGMKFLEKRGKDPRFDEAVDKKLVELAQKGDVILDSWTMPWLLKKGFKIWLEASPEKRAERIVKRDRMSFKKALEALKCKEKQTQTIYRKMYGFSLGDDFEPFHFILDTESLNAEEVFQVLCIVMDSPAFHRDGTLSPDP
jgi:cytidylate kinase